MIFRKVPLRLLFLFSIYLFWIASSLYSQQIDLNKVKADEEFRWGVEAFHKGYLNESILSLKRSLSYQPENPLTRIWLARAYIQSGFEDAGLSELKGVLNAGVRDIFLQSWVELLETGRGLRRELQPPPRWVFVAEIEGTQGETVLFKGPTVVRSRSDGTFYVVSYVKNEILLLDVNGVLVRSLRGGLAGFDHPFDIIEGENGSFYVSEFRGDRVALCSSNGNKIRVFGSKGRAPGSLLGPQYLARDEAGNIYVSEYGNRRISKFDNEGTFLTTFGERTEFFEGFTAPAGILVKEDQVYVADMEKKQLLVFDTNGNYLNTLLKGRLIRPEGLTRMGNRILIADGNRLVSYDVETDTLQPVVEYGAQAKRILLADLDANGNILAGDFDANAVHILSELSGMYSGLSVRVQRIDASSHPEVYLDVRVTDRFGNPIVGLNGSNFLITERRSRVGKTEFLFASHRDNRFEIAVLVERSLKALEAREILGRVAQELGRIFQGRGNFRVISASSVPSVTFKPQDRWELLPIRIMDSSPAYSDRWAFDLGARLAITEIMPSRFRKAILYLTTGELTSTSFQNFGLTETVGYMRNNGVVFYPLYIQNETISRELEFLARETGGKSYRFSDPQGISPLVSDLRQQKEGVYVLKYTSREDTDFGRRYIPVEVETQLIRRSGREEIGYFGPLKF